MKEKYYALSLILAVAMAIAMVAMTLLQALAPAAILPELNIPNMTALSLVALLIEHYFAPNSRRCYFCVVGFSLLTFGLLPFAAGVAALEQVWKVAMIGCVLFTLLTWLFDSIMDRLSTGPKAKFAPVISAFGLYLAFQIFAGILL